MTHTYSLDHVVVTTEFVSVEVAAKSEMTLQFTGPDPLNKDATIAVYRLLSGDAAYPANVTYRVENQTRKGAKIRRASMTFDTWAADDNSVDGTTARKPISGTISVNIPAEITTELADMDDMLGNMFSFMYASVSAGARNTGYLNKLFYGLPQVV